MSLAFSNILLTPGRSCTDVIIFTYCEPCPGNSSPTGMSGSMDVNAAFG
eukprot:CAMPEP_0185907618 /NCGR_PEP_ID=MMETSP0196C-20130402/7409_1 /TAXON_ID=2932 /ORGANISM="Alexandrium fundyense, Strain CCMP1719" /LENGTH=48 /DNA_ID= /DNA_START= /DNA_END= /DNA_ORIENTATION=